MNEQTKAILLNENLRWAVYAECTAKNNGKNENFNRLLAVFTTPIQAEDFIKKCLPAENISRFKMVELTANLKTYLLKVRQYDITINNYKLKVYKVTTDNIYRVIGKIHSTALEHIERIDYSEWLEEREKFWIDRGYTVTTYREEKLSEDY